MLFSEVPNVGFNYFQLAPLVVLLPLAGLLLRELHILAFPLPGMGPLDRVVASAGAGFYEHIPLLGTAMRAIRGTFDDS